MPSQHKHPPVAYRPPGDLRAWLLARSETTGQPVNAIITDALGEYRSRREPQAGSEPDCPHPKARVIKGLCGACGTHVGKAA